MGAKVIVFPEAFIVGYPKGLSYGLVVGARDSAGREEFRIYLEAAIEVPGPYTQRLAGLHQWRLNEEKDQATSKMGRRCASHY